MRFQATTILCQSDVLSIIGPTFGQNSSFYRTNQKRWKKHFKHFLFALRAERVSPLTHVSVSLRLRKYKLAARSCEPGARPRLGSPPWSYVETICNLTFPRGPHRNHAPGTEIQEERPPPPTLSLAQVSRNTSAELTLNDG